jgi:hypothetical protein
LVSGFPKKEDPKPNPPLAKTARSPVHRGGGATRYFFSSFFASAAGADEELDGAALEEDEDELSEDDGALGDEGAVLDEPVEGEDGEAGALEAGGVLLELEEGDLAGALSLPHAASANAPTTAMSSALFMDLSFVGLGVGTTRYCRNSEMKLASGRGQFRRRHSPTVVLETAG